MLCSSCNDPVRPVVALDIDGTLGDYHTHFLSFAVEYLGENNPPTGVIDYGGNEPYKRFFMRTFGCQLRTFRDIKLAYRQGAQKRSMPTYPGAAALTQELVAAGAEVWITTTRPYLRLDNIDPDTREWLNRNEIEFTYILYGDDKYEALAERVDERRVVAVLDDLPEQLRRAEALWSGAAIQRRTYWNRETPEMYPSVLNLKEAREMITDRIHEWKAAEWKTEPQLSSAPARAPETSVTRSEGS